MNMHWVKVLIAAVFEIFWVIGLGHAYNVWTWAGTIAAIVVSNYFLITATKELPTGTVYAVFVGLGTAGAVVSEILLFGEPFNVMKILLIMLLLAGVIGLKLVTDDDKKKGAES